MDCPQHQGERHYRWRYQTVVRNRSGCGLEREQGLHEPGRFAVGYIECDGQSLRNHKDEYFGLPGEARRRLLCPSGNPCGKGEGDGHRKYRGVGSRFCFFGQCARTDYQYVQSDEQIGCGHTFYQTSAGYQFRL